MYIVASYARVLIFANIDACMMKYEGAAFQDGRTPSIWDTFAHAGQFNSFACSFCYLLFALRIG